MAKAVGSEKSGGRKKGTPNKRTFGFGELLVERGIDLLDEILNEAKTLTASARVSVYVSLLLSQFFPDLPNKFKYLTYVWLVIQ